VSNLKEGLMHYITQNRRYSLIPGPRNRKELKGNTIGNLTKLTATYQAYYKLRQILRNGLEIEMPEQSFGENAVRWHECRKFEVSTSETLVNLTRQHGATT
jgi:hypothetical protein